MKSEIRPFLRDITKPCDPCQQTHNEPHSFLVSFATPEARVNEKIMVGFVQSGKNVADRLDIMKQAALLSAVRTGMLDVQP